MASAMLTSEYQRAYQPFAFGDSISRGCMAGLSSMDLAITREPALQQKKKSPDRMRRAPHISTTVNALIDPIDEVGKTTSQLKSLKTIQYQKLRELNNPLRLPLSEYALQYKWKAPGEPSPLMLAENQLQQQKYNPLQNINNDKVVPRHKLDLHKPPVQPREGVKGKLAFGDDENGSEEEGQHDCSSVRERADVGHGGGQRHHRRKHKDKERSKHKKHQGTRRWKPIPLSTEYRQQFKMWPLNTATAENPPKDLKGVSPAVLPPAGSPPRLHSPSDPRLQRHSPMKMNPPKHSSIPKTTEYDSNYKSPVHCKYIQGAWVQSDASGKKNTQEQNSGSWLAQVQELKEKCNEYKTRSHGTFFSRDYLDHLERQQLSLLETASTALSTATSDTCSTCDTSTVVSEDVKVEDVEDVVPGEDHHEDTVPTRQVLSTPKVHTPDGSHPSHRASEEDSVASGSSGRSTQPEITQPRRRQELNKSQPRPVSQVRPPTPELKGQSHWGTRHHLNRTTPFSGAFFSPQKNHSTQHTVAKTHPVSPRYRRDMASRAPIFPATAQHNTDQYATEKGLHRENPQILKQNRRNLYSVHKGRDHMRREENTLPDFTKETSGGLECSVCGAELDNPAYMNSSQLKATKKKQSVKKKRDVRVGQNPHNSSPNLAAPRSSKKNVPADLESLSDISASSCSIASSVLERARERRDNFWKE